MPKDKIRVERNDFSGGLNVSANGDTLNDNELTVCQNARIEPFGGIMRRPGSKLLIQDTSLLDGQPIHSVFQWTVGGVRQVIAVCEAILFYSNDTGAGYGALAQAAGAVGYNKHIPNVFQPFRNNSFGAPLVLFIASGGQVFKFDGTTSTLLSGTNSVPFATTVRAFGTRLFYNDTTLPKTLFWSKIGAGDDCGTGGLSGGGSALTDVLSGDSITALEVLGGSVLIGTEYSIARFTGTADSIQILQDSQGVSNEVGPTNPHGVVRAGGVAFLDTLNGPYVATEGGVLSIGDKIWHPDATALQFNRSAVDGDGSPIRPVLGHNPSRFEIWYAYVPIGGTRRSSVMVYNYKRQCWYGPFLYGFGITCFSVYEDSVGRKSIMCGCDDANIRLLDDPTYSQFDDGRDDFDAVVEFAPFRGPDPYVLKSLEHVFLQAIGAHTFTVTATGDLGATDEGSFIG